MRTPEQRRKHAEYMRRYIREKPEQAKKAQNRMEEWYKRNKDRAKATKRRGDLRRRYKMTVAEWDARFAQQGQKCAICRAENQRWHTDHDHRTGKIRGILCVRCNGMLGYALDDPLRLKLGASYLELLEK